MKRYILIGALAMTAPGLVCAQDYDYSQSQDYNQSRDYSQSQDYRQGQEYSQFGPSTGDREFTISGSGTSDENLDNGSFSANGEFGWYLTDQFEVGVRQGVSWTHNEHNGHRWNGATRGFLDYHFGQRVRPFVGTSLGYKYGESVDNTGFAGLEAGLKYYVLESTFIMGRAEWQFFFSSTDSIDSGFSDGSFVYTVGLGYNF